MKIFNLIKRTPFLLILTIILLLTIFNQKQYTRLKILIWNTPSLSLGSYLAISTGTGFILSYFMTNNLIRSQFFKYIILASFIILLSLIGILNLFL